MARIPGHMVEKALKTCPRSFRLCGRHEQYDMLIDGRHTYTSGGTCSRETIDLETGKRRNSTKEDAVSVTKILDHWEGMNGLITPVVPRDVPPGVQELHAFDAVVNNTEKHYMTVTLDNPRDAELLIEMAAAVVGGKEELRRRPIISALFCGISPLTWSSGSAEALIRLAEAHIPVNVDPVVMLGASAPATPAAGLLIGNTQFLAMLTLVQAVNPGNPTLYEGTPGVMDMKTGAYNQSCPEAMLIKLGYLQMARYYDVRTSAVGFENTSKTPDIQAAYEGTLVYFSNCVGGADLTNAMGSLEVISVLSYEQLVIDYEIARMVQRVMAGIEVSDETLALGEILAADHKGSFLTTKHTLRHMRDGWSPILADPRAYEVWKAAGGKTVLEKAREEVKAILAEHKPTPLNEGIRDELRAIIKGAERMDS